jgi:hypothetical protein
MSFEKKSSFLKEKRLSSDMSKEDMKRQEIINEWVKPEYSLNIPPNFLQIDTENQYYQDLLLFKNVGPKKNFFFF